MWLQDVTCVLHRGGGARGHNVFYHTVCMMTASGTSGMTCMSGALWGPSFHGMCSGRTTLEQSHGLILQRILCWPCCPGARRTRTTLVALMPAGHALQLAGASSTRGCQCEALRNSQAADAALRAPRSLPAAPVRPRVCMNS